MRQVIQGEDTIVAIATPPGRGAIAVIRVSGHHAHTITRRLVSPWPKAARVATLCQVRDDREALLDQTVVTVYAGPQSYTGEDVVEIATHGGLVAPTLVMAALIRQGAREALPGEFTRRAVLNGKLDLIQAEAIGDLIDAGSRAMHRAALRQLDGGLSQRINMLREKIIHVEALIAYDIDFPEEDDGPIARSRVATGIREVVDSLSALLATAPAGEMIRVGAVVVIAGPPNTGKSSLFNALLGSNRAIVTDVPGTTRDAIEAVIDAGPWPIRLVDTAGLRETQDVVERIGIEVSARYLSSADVVLACGDTEESVEETFDAVKGLTQAPVLRVYTKADLVAGVPRDGGAGSESALFVSAVTGSGLDVLLNHVNGVISEKYGQPSLDAPILMRERQKYAIQRARDEMDAFERAWEEEILPPSIAAVHLRAATHALEEVVGEIGVEDILDRLFQAFCVGK